MIDIIIPIYNPNFRLLEEVLTSIIVSNIRDNYSIRLCFGDESWRSFSEQTRFNIKIETGYPKGEWRAVEKAYDESKADYVAICHQDDFWLKDKLNHQMRYINECALCLTSFIYNYDSFYNPHMRNAREVAHPSIDSIIGLWNCMPSTWLINKSKLTLLPIPYDNGITHCMDQAIAMAMGISDPIIAIKTPFVIYNDHGSNQMHQVDQSILDRARKSLQDYYQQIKPFLQLKEVWS